MSGVPQALDGVNVVLIGGYAAGPWIGKLMANFGAKVVHVEARDRPDGFRMQYPPFKGGEKGINRGGCFTYFNDSQYGITLDVKKPGGVELARRLADWCDVLIENMRPGVIDRIGLGYEALKETNLDLIMLSTCNMGQTGPRAHTPGFGSQLSALAGFCDLTGVSGGPPMLLYGPYIDFIAAHLGAAAILAALDNRRRTGKGAFIDVSQYECGLSFVAGALLEYHASGRIAERAGNDDPTAVPHGAYRCRDEQWLALSCWSDGEFARLAKAVEHAEWAEDARFSDAAARRENIAALEDGIAAWCAPRDADEAATILQTAGVHSYRVNTVAELFSDPQLRHRRSWRVRRHPVIGDQSYYFPGIDLSETPGDVTAAAPLLGGDNEMVFRDFLGLTEEEYETYESQGVIG